MEYPADAERAGPLAGFTAVPRGRRTTIRRRSQLELRRGMNMPATPVSMMTHPVT